jgi:excinuclease ABC subunit B
METIFNLRSDMKPLGDQARAIGNICHSLNLGHRHHVLLGVTGSGKTFTMANVIAQLGRPALIIAPNKTLAAQLFTEFRALFPEDYVGFFISYYDYYQPEAYVPNTDTYIAKDAAINDDIEKMRHGATQALFEHRNVIIVASVSCIYGLGSPDTYSGLALHLEKGQELSRDQFLRDLIDIQYSRNDRELQRGHFRVRGDSVDIQPAHESQTGIRVQFFGDEIEEISIIDALTGKDQRSVQNISIYPNSHYVTDQRDKKLIVREILHDLGVRLKEFREQNKFVQYQRLEQRTMQDIETIEQLGFCPGIENYTRYLTGKKPGEPPPSLLDYFAQDYLTFIDESHITVPQIGGMYRGDRSRKQVLVDYGFRLPSALDNRPLNFDEFLQRSHQIVYVSATPAAFELNAAQDQITEQIIRPTGLIDPEIFLRPARIQVDDLLGEIKATVSTGRVLVTTLTKRMAEDLTTYYRELGINIRYLHSDIDSIARVELLRDLRKGEYDVLVGINLLREGLDLPEVKLVAVMDADKEGFLRSHSSLIQIVGRAARNVEAKVIFYADRVTRSMQLAMDETSRRRDIQKAHNTKYGIEPKTIIKELPTDLRAIYGLSETTEESLSIPPIQRLKELGIEKVSEIHKVITKKTKEMKRLAATMEFEKAAALRDEIKELSELMMTLMEGPKGDDGEAGTP